MRFSGYGRDVLVRWGVMIPALLAAMPLLLAVTRGHWLMWIFVFSLPLGIAAFTFYFFRDPDREIPGDALTVVSPADGTVTDLGVRSETEYFKREVQYVGIFLSIFDVHVNRAPLDGEVDYLAHREGKYLDARDPQSGTLNECRNIGARMASGARFYVRQISGLVARNIVCPLKVGDALKRGERFGMIKFGSRTELYLDDAFEVEWKVKIGDKVKGGATALAVLKPKG